MFSHLLLILVATAALASARRLSYAGAPAPVSQEIAEATCTGPEKRGTRFHDGAVVPQCGLFLLLFCCTIRTLFCSVLCCRLQLVPVRLRLHLRLVFVTGRTGTGPLEYSPTRGRPTFYELLSTENTVSAMCSGVCGRAGAPTSRASRSATGAAARA